RPDLQPEPAPVGPLDAASEVPADRVLPDPALAGGGAALRALDGLRGQSRGASVRLRFHAGVARRARRTAAQAPAAPAVRRLRKWGAPRWPPQTPQRSEHPSPAVGPPRHSDATPS